MNDRFQPPSGLADQVAQRALSDVSRVFDSQPRLNFRAETATALSVAPGEIRRLAPRSGGQTVVLPAAAPDNAGQSVTLLVNGLGVLTVMPVTGTINGASALTYAAGSFMCSFVSDGVSWLTERTAENLTRSQQFSDTVTGTLDPYLLPAAFRSGDSIVWVITGNVTLNRIRMSDGSIPPDGTELKLALRDQSGGAAPGWSITIVDTGAVTSNGSFRTPGQVQGTSPGPSYVMQSEEEGCHLVCLDGNWRLIGGTAAQALAGDVTVPAGNGSTRTATLSNSVILPAHLAPAASSIGVLFASRTVFTAGAAGTADDITIYNANAPFAFRILDVWVQIATAIGGSTVQLRDTSGGGGGALSSALSSAGTGTARNNDTVSRLVAANGSIFLRRSDRGVAGEVCIVARPA